MSREIKFRAWDIQQNKWCGYEDTGPVIDLYHSITSNCFMVDNDSYDFPRDLILCQYIGLKDKNGVEIYEGDILEWPTSGERQAVKFVDGMFYVGDMHSIAVYKPYIEVIGNIYENPELLEK